MTELKEIAKNFTEIKERRYSVRKKAKDANTVIEECCSWEEKRGRSQEACRRRRQGTNNNWREAI